MSDLLFMKQVNGDMPFSVLFNVSNTAHHSKLGMQLHC